MKRTHLFLLFATVILSACGQGGYNEPVNPGGGGGTTPGGTTQNLKADFTYTTNIMSVTFTNTSSSGLSVYSWNFGDGKSVTGGNSVSHDYTKEGAYSVVLTCIDKDNKKYTCTKEVSVKDNPTGQDEFYVGGYTLYNIPTNNYYYRVVIAGYVWNGSQEFEITNGWNKIGFSDLPYSCTVSNPYYLGYEDAVAFYDHFTVWVYWNKQTSGNGTQCLKQNFSIDSSNIKNEYVVISNNGDTKIGITISRKKS